MRPAVKQGLLLVLVCSAFSLSGLFLTSLHDPEQGMYGDIAATMAAGGEWVTPRFNGVAFLNKPPLVFWLTGLSMLVLGSSDWVVRLWSALPVLLTAMLIWNMGERLYGHYAGVAAAVIFASNLAVLLYARVPATDFLLVLWLTLAMFAFVKVVLSPDARWFVLLFYGAAGLAVLTKGLLGLLLPLMILMGFYGVLLAWRRVPEGLKRHVNASFRTLFFSGPALWGWLLFASLVVPWHVMAELRNPGFFDYHVIDNQMGRFFATRVFVEDDVSSTMVSFLVVSLLLFFPWSVFLPAALRVGFPQLNQDCSLTRCLGSLIGVWAVSILVFFSWSGSKLEHYGLPALPALSLMVGGYWAASMGVGKPPKGLTWTLVLAAVILGLGGFILVTFSGRIGPAGLFAGLAEIDAYYRILKDQGEPFPFESVAPFIQFAKGFGMVLLVGFPLALLSFAARWPRLSFSVIVLSVGLIFVLGYRLAPVFESQQSAKPVSLALLDLLRPRDRIVHEGMLEYSAGLPFYAGERVRVLNGRRGVLEFGSRYPEADGFFIDTDEFVRMWKGSNTVFLVTRFSPENSLIRHLPYERVRALGRFGSKWLYRNETVDSSR